MRESFQNVKATHDLSDVNLACDSDNILIEAHRIILATGSFSASTSSSVPGRSAEDRHEGHFWLSLPRSSGAADISSDCQEARVKGLQSEEKYNTDQDTNIELEEVHDKDPIKDCKLVNWSFDDKKALSTPQHSAVWRFMDRLDYNSAQFKECGMAKNSFSGSTTKTSFLNPTQIIYARRMINRPGEPGLFYKQLRH